MATILGNIMCEYKHTNNCPTIVNRADPNFDLPSCPEAFADRLFVNYKNVKLALCKFLGDNFVLAGDTVCEALIREPIKMYDFYIIGDVDIVKLIDELATTVKKLNPDVVLFCTTGRWIWYSIFFIIRVFAQRYASIEGLLQNFDIDAAAVAFDGKQVYFTTNSIKAYTTGCITINLEKRRLMLERRIRQYFNYGFNIKFPDLDINTVGGYLRFHSLYIEVKSINGNNIEVYMPFLENTDQMVGLQNQLYANICRVQGGNDPIVRNDGDPFAATSWITLNEATEFYNNIGKLITRPLQTKAHQNFYIKYEECGSLEETKKSMINWIMSIQPYKMTFDSPFVLQPMAPQEWYGNHYKHS
jgi:hypothetical protein